MKRFAAIDVGSYELAMKIFEISGKGGLKCIDHIRHRIELGTDTYNTGKISQPRVEELCRVLSNFKDIMKSYKTDDYKAYGTSAIRETRNTMIILEQIKLKTGLTVGVLSNSEQRLLHYKAIASRGDKFNEFIKKGCAIVDIGGGSIQISLFDDEKLVTTQNLRLGILRMREMLSDLQPKTNDYAHLIEELCDNHLKPFESLYLKDTKIENIILVDDYISHFMNKVYNADTLTADEYKKFGSYFKKNRPSDIAKLMGVPEENISLMMPSALLLRRILKYTNAETLWAPGVDLADGIAYEYAEKEKILKNLHNFDEDIIAGARNMCLKYQGNIARNELLERIAVTFFDATRKIHGMGARERLLLRTAAILNDCGRYISLEDAAECSYSIIMATEMIGLSHAEREMVANVVKFNKTDFEYYDRLSISSTMSTADYLTVSKLTAIFRVADGICRSYRAKVNGIRVTMKDDEMIINVDSNDDIILERGFFERKARFFEEAFSIRPVLKYKKKLSTI